MANLIVFDKDGTLTRPKSGKIFPQSPQDQELLPGVLEHIELLRSNRWIMAIASNQDGCDISTTQASRVRVGNYIVHGKDDRYLVVGIDTTSDDGLIFRYDRERPTGKEYSFSFPDSSIRVAHKSIKSAIEEVRFAADLCGITEAVFCPVMNGSEMWSLVKDIEYGWLSMLVRSLDDPEDSPNFRKPGSGMLEYLRQLRVLRVDRAVMVGDRPEDRAAAALAGFEFYDAEDWRHNRTPI